MSDQQVVVGLAARRVVSGPSDAWVVACAICSAIGALFVVTVTVPFLVGFGVVAVRSRRLAVLGLVLLVAGTLADRSLDGLRAPLADEVSGRVVLVGDPEHVNGAVRVDVRHEGRRYESWSRGATGRRIAALASGESVQVDGALDAFDDEWPGRLARHVAARLVVDSAEQPRTASGPVGWANSVRRLVVDGADSLSDRDRVLLTGFTVGDDRQQLPQVTDDFRAAGLTHLTAVSGQNVAFVLLLIGPVLSRLGPRARLVLIAAVLAQFGLMTRWEPSVMRAVAMAIAAAAGQLVPGERSGIRQLAMVVTLLLFVDPLLVHSVGFRLSVLASVGIATIYPWLRIRMPGPAVVRDPLALTVAAQVGVAPALITTFGTMPLISVPANMAAGPASGPLMAWGLVAGPIAGFAGGPMSTALHLPTRVLTGFVAGVARVAAGIGGPELDLRSFLVVVGVCAFSMLMSGRVTWAAVAVSVVAAMLLAPTTEFDVRGAELHHSGGAFVLVVDRPSPERLLAGLRRADVGSLDVVVVVSRSAQAVAAFGAIESRHSIGQVYRPAGGSGAGAIVARPTSFTAGGLVFELQPDGRRVSVAVVADDRIAEEGIAEEDVADEGVAPER